MTIDRTVKTLEKDAGTELTTLLRRTISNPIGWFYDKPNERYEGRTPHEVYLAGKGEEVLRDVKELVERMKETNFYDQK